jgi:hypothetical protein
MGEPLREWPRVEREALREAHPICVVREAPQKILYQSLQKLFSRKERERRKEKN